METADENKVSARLDTAAASASLAAAALAEDHFNGDVTTQALSDYLKANGKTEKSELNFSIVAKEDGVFSGLRWVEEIFSNVGIVKSSSLEEGQSIQKGKTVLAGRGSWNKVLSFERTLLNELQHLCGVATQTRRYVDEVSRAWSRFQLPHSQCPKIYHTRKTLPLMRAYQIEAVIAGGGALHRENLASQIFVKENHKYILQEHSLAYPDFAREIIKTHPRAIFEVENLEEAFALDSAGVKNLLLDNFSPDQVKQCLAKLSADIEVEVSGGLNFQNISHYVLPRVQRLSLGALTHSVKAVDISLDWSFS